MTRAQAIKFADAIVAVARSVATDKAKWTEVEFPATLVANKLRKSEGEVVQTLLDNAPAVWAVLPMGWRLRFVHSSSTMTLEVRRAL